MENLLLLVVNVWMMGLIIAVLHAISPKYGFAPLLLILGAMMGALESQVYLYIEPTEGLRFFVSATLFVPTIVMGILILYIANGTMPARLTIFAILGASLLALFVRVMFRAQLELPDAEVISFDTSSALLAPIGLRETIASLLAYGSDMFVIAVFYQGMRNHFQLPRWLMIGLALMAALWTDAIVFNMVARLGSDDFMRFFPGDVVAKTFAAVVIWPVAAVYLIRFAPHLPEYQGDRPRATFDLLFGEFEQVMLTLSRTQQQLAETKALQVQEMAYQQQFMDNVEEAFWMHSPGEYACFYINKAYERIWGITAQEYFTNPHTWVNSIYRDDRARILTEVKLHSEEPYEIEYRIVRPDGDLRWIRDRGFPIRNERGEIYRVAGISEDITARKDVERAQLELEVEREKVMFLRQFIGEVTHDLRTPLAALDLKIYLMQRTTDADKQRLHLNELGSITSRMGRLIEDLMTLARLENVSTLTLTLVNLGALIQSLLDEVQPIVDSKKLQVEFVPPDPPLWLHVDDTDLGRALGNLINNAVHYTPEGGRVEVGITDYGNEVAIVVRDTGIGIPDEELPQVFTRFFRATNAKAVDPGGTGLGLAIVQRVVQQHGGKVLVESKVGEGTKFTVRLPIRKE
ncbi:MAG: PAS domain-containing sensor histidine kinase [Anaerolineae bacterium]|nr:PAS domain-containing sensor histidine kinase [Anaerolineae bacterium]